MIAPNTVLDGRFHILKKLGEGGMGLVWIGTDLQSQSSNPTKVIIKELKTEFIEDEYVLKGFFKEVEALKRIDHKGVVKFLAAGKQEDELPYLAIEFIEGVTLRSQIKQGGIIDLARVANIIAQLGKAIGAAHACGVCHRDLKPENIMLKIDDKEDQEIVKVIDFGIATIKSRHDSETKTTMMAGTVNYMAPEQIKGKPSFNTDIYAMGVIAYEMVTGAMPFNVRSLRAPANVLKLYEMQSQSPQGVVHPQALRPDLSREADALIMATLAFDPKSRPNRADLFGSQLAEALRQDAEDEGDLPTIRHSLNNSRGDIPTAYYPNNTSDTRIGNPATSTNASALNTLHKSLKPADDQTIPSQPALKNSPRSSKIVIEIGIAIMLVLIGIGLNHYFSGEATSKSLPITKETSSPITSVKTPTSLGKPLLLNYSISLSESEGKSEHKPYIELAGEEILFHDKDLFKFNLRSEQNIFLYIINESPEIVNNRPKYTLLYPGKGEDNLLKQGKLFTLPGEKDPGLEFTGSKGLEKIWLVMATEKIPQLDALSKFFNSRNLGVVSDDKQIDSIKLLLDKPFLSQPEIDTEKKKVSIHSMGDITISLIKLEHN